MSSTQQETASALREQVRQIRAHLKQCGGKLNLERFTWWTAELAAKEHELAALEAMDSVEAAQ
jgi:hypothetical protein